MKAGDKVAWTSEGKHEAYRMLRRDVVYCVSDTNVDRLGRLGIWLCGFEYLPPYPSGFVPFFLADRFRLVSEVGFAALAARTEDRK